MFSKEPRNIYNNNQLYEVICQLRFPEILSIETELPAKFQEGIRNIFPRYSLHKERGAGKETNNYQFTTEDGLWRVNLTSKFISISTNAYKCWEDFAAMLDLPLASFIQVYQPACFDRIGLRYLNFISRKALGLEDCAFKELITPAYLGILSFDDINEGAAARSSVDAEIAIGGGSCLKMHAGAGKIAIAGKTDNETKFVLDLDLFIGERIAVNHSTGVLQTLHSQAFSVFRCAITDKLHDAML